MTETAGPLQPESTQERRPIPDAIVSGETGGLYTVAGADLITNVQLAEVGETGTPEERIKEIEGVVMEALSFTDGLENGPYAADYDLDDEATILRLQNQFTTSESSVHRYQDGQLREAVKDKLTKPLRVAKLWGSSRRRAREAKFLERDLNQQYGQMNQVRVSKGEAPISDADIKAQIAIQIHNKILETEKTNSVSRELIRLQEHVEARVLFDGAFVQRQLVCEERVKQADMASVFGAQVAKPDKGHWPAYYKGNQEWGHAVDAVEKRMIDVMRGEVPGLEDVYVEGFSTPNFTKFIQEMLPYSKVDGEARMDVIFAAHKQTLFKEMPAHYAYVVTEEGKMKFGFPPFVSGLHTWTEFPEEHRAVETGWNDQTLQNAKDPQWRGQVYGKRTQPLKAVSHAGHPASVGKVLPRGLCGSFMHETEVGDKSLHQIMYEEGLSQADESFPWADLEEVQAGAEAGEPPSGSVGSWMLKRLRAHSVIDSLQGMRPLGELTSFTAVEKLRNWQKLQLVTPGLLVDSDTLGNDVPTNVNIKHPRAVPDNPIVWKALGELSFYMFDRDPKGDLTLVASSLKERMEAGDASTEGRGSPKAMDYVSNLRKIGAISQEEEQWLKKKLNI